MYTDVLANKEIKRKCGIRPCFCFLLNLSCSSKTSTLLMWKATWRWNFMEICRACKCVTLPLRQWTLNDRQREFLTVKLTWHYMNLHSFPFVFVPDNVCSFGGMNEEYEHTSTYYFTLAIMQNQCGNQWRNYGGGGGHGGHVPWMSWT